MLFKFKVQSSNVKIQNHYETRQRRDVHSSVYLTFEDDLMLALISQLIEKKFSSCQGDRAFFQ